MEIEEDEIEYIKEEDIQIKIKLDNNNNINKEDSDIINKLYNINYKNYPIEKLINYDNYSDNRIEINRNSYGYDFLKNEYYLINQDGYKIDNNNNIIKKLNKMLKMDENKVIDYMKKYIIFDIFYYKRVDNINDVLLYEISKIEFIENVNFKIDDELLLSKEEIKELEELYYSENKINFKLKEIQDDKGKKQILLLSEYQKNMNKLKELFLENNLEINDEIDLLKKKFKEDEIKILDEYKKKKKILEDLLFESSKEIKEKIENNDKLKKLEKKKENLDKELQNINKFNNFIVYEITKIKEKVKEVKEIKDELKNELKDELKDELKNELKDELKDELSKVKNETNQVKIEKLEEFKDNYIKGIRYTLPINKKQILTNENILVSMDINYFNYSLKYIKFD